MSENKDLPTDFKRNGQFYKFCAYGFLKNLRFFEPFFILIGRDKILHFHLFEFTGAEDKIAGGDLIAERLADLRYPEGDFLT